MEQDDLKKRFITCLILILTISAVFTIKSFWDNRAGVRDSQKLQEIYDKLEAKAPSGGDYQILHAERMELQEKMSRHYGFPKLFFLPLVALNSILAFWGLKIISRFPHDTSVARRSSFRLMLALLVFFVVIFCFFLLEYHKVSRFGWAFFLFLLQCTLTGFVLAVGISDEVYDAVMGNKKDKSLIEGPPPPAW